MFKSFFMPEKTGLSTGDKFCITGTDGDCANRRCRGLADGRLGLFTDIRTCFDLGLAGCNFHGKGQTGGDAAFAAVLFGQHLENLYTG